MRAYPYKVEYHPQIGPGPRLENGRRSSVSPALRQWVFARDNFQCQECGYWEDLEIDHVFPRYFGGSDWASNLTTLCMPCHRAHHCKWEFYTWKGIVETWEAEAVENNPLTAMAET